jgi:L-iditol 2-dehydrogenase
MPSRYRVPTGMRCNRLELTPTTMLAARLHGPREVRVEQVPHPGPPGSGEVLLRSQFNRICGSDLHSYQDARIGDTPIQGSTCAGA